MISTLQRQRWFGRASTQARGLLTDHLFKRARQRHQASAHPSFASNDSTVRVRGGLMPPLLAGLAAAALFALALAFFMTPTKSIGFAPDQYAEQQRTRWAGAVRSDSAVRTAVSDEPVADTQMPLQPPTGGVGRQATVVVPARTVIAVEALEAPLGAPILLATRIGAEQAAVGFSADGDGPLGAREALAFLQPATSSKPAPRSDPVAGRVQQLLNDLGYDAGPVDGKPGKQTWTAIERFRQDRSLPADSPLDVALIDDLERARNDGWQAAPTTLAGAGN